MYYLKDIDQWRVYWSVPMEDTDHNFTITVVRGTDPVTVMEHVLKEVQQIENANKVILPLGHGAVDGRVGSSHFSMRVDRGLYSVLITGQRIGA